MQRGASETHSCGFQLGLYTVELNFAAGIGSGVVEQAGLDECICFEPGEKRLKLAGRLTACGEIAGKAFVEIQEGCVKGNSFAIDISQDCRISTGEAFGFVQKRVDCLEKSEIKIGECIGRLGSERGVGGYFAVLQKVDAVKHGSGCRPILRPTEPVGQLVIGLAGILHHLQSEPDFKGVEAGFTGGFTFDEESLHFVVAVEGHILLEVSRVEIRRVIRFRIHDPVVPDSQVWRDVCPAEEIVVVVLVTRVAVGKLRVGLAGGEEFASEFADADDDIRGRLDVFGRVECESVGKGLDKNVRVILGDIVGDEVDEVEKDTAVGAFAFKNSCAGGALAFAAAVVMADVVDAGEKCRRARLFSVPLDKGAQLGTNGLACTRTGETELRGAGTGGRTDSLAFFVHGEPVVRPFFGRVGMEGVAVTG